jgi:aminoglycoside 6'-N-acetyltransferase
MEFLPIESERLDLRRFVAGDLAAFQAYRRDPELARYQGWDPMSDDEAAALLAEQGSVELGPFGQWLQVAIVERATGALVGDIGVCLLEPGDAEIGYTLSSGAQGRGYATEAVRALVGALFTAGLERVQATTDARNTKSIALLERIGMRYVRTETAIFRGESCLEHTYEITQP